jgi:hypothetical protein
MIVTAIKKRLAGLLLLIIGILPTYAQQAHKIYVSPNGKKTGSGEIKAPLATIEQALKLANIRSGKTKKPVEIILRGGVYPISSTLEIVQRKTWN